MNIFVVLNHDKRGNSDTNDLWSPQGDRISFQYALHTAIMQYIHI